jgi:energy-coupling factor transporter transmembrane protein EcfT
MVKPNIITQLLGFFVLAIMLNQLAIKVLLGLLFLLIALLIWTKTWQFLRTIKRFKWFFIVMMLIFAFNTPGEHVSNWPFSIMSPTYEGLQAGAMQTMRIVCMLAALSLILSNNSKQQLISGFYFILSPLKYLGLAVERFAARLWLTLHYVELQNIEAKHTAGQHANKLSLMDRLKTMTELKNTNIETNFNTIEFSIPSFGWLDYVAIAVLIGISVKAFV